MIDFSRATTLAFTPATENFTIERPFFDTPESNTIINSSPEVAPHTLFNMRDPWTGEEHREALDIRVWRDNSVLEVFVNGRTAISTRLYAAEETIGIRFFADDKTSMAESACSGLSELVSGTLWDGIGI